ncbi:MAG TPA: ATP-binding protein [Candidatus Acidoferrum sp.]|nr:ATP-binding protein [Candidatus Acidoferrum sp.]
MLRHKSTHAAVNSLWREKDVIYVVLAGRQPEDIAQKALDDFRKLIAEIKAEGKKPFVFVDLRQLSLADVSVAARLAIKEAFKEPYAALVAVGKTRLLEVAMYLIRASQASKRVRYFVSERRAMHWLKARQTNPTSRSAGLLLASFVIGFIGVAGIIGWLTGNIYLLRIVPELRPINPMGGFGLVLLGLGLASVWAKNRRAALVLSILLTILGALALLPRAVNLNFLPVANQPLAANLQAYPSESGAICLLIAAALLLLAFVKRPLIRLSAVILAAGILLVALFNAFGLLYASSFFYNLQPSLMMSLHVALALVIFSLAYAAELARERWGANIFAQANRIGWLIVVVMVFAQAATYGAWRQSVARAQETSASAFSGRVDDIVGSVTNRIQAYTDVLRGFRGLYAASDYVEQGEFQAFYQATNVASSYPGLRGLSYIAKVNTKDLAAFLALHKADTSLIPGGHPAMSYQNLSKSDTHYIVTYSATAPASNALSDLTDAPGRVEAFGQAAATNNLVASDSFLVAAENKLGFFMTVPLQNRHPASVTSAPVIGFVNVVFTYDDLFAKLLQSQSLGKGVSIKITDSEAPGTAVYFANDLRGNAATLSQRKNIAVANRIWTITVGAPASFGASASESYQAAVILAGGQIFSVLMLVIFIVQNDARRRALQLADTITADLQYERNEAVATRQKDETIFGDIAEGLIIFDKHARIIRVNAAARETLGLAENELLGQPFDKVLIAYDETDKLIPLNKRPMARTIAEKRVVSQQLRYQRRDGSLFDAQVTNSPLIINGKLDGVIEIFRDITKEKEIDKAKTEFVSLASHQLRTPLSTINWYAEMLLAGDAGKITGEQKKYVDEIYRGNKRMTDLVGALLNVSRIDLGTFVIEPEMTNIVTLAQNTVRDLEPRIFQRKIDFEEQYEPRMPKISLDPKLIRMVVENLCSNAVKYTPEGGKVVLAIKREQDWLSISIQDTGYGIPKDQQSKIFTKLFRADNAKSQDIEGNGLGLYIVKSIVEYSGGKIWFESEQDKGTTFHVELPLAGMKKKVGTKTLD